MMILANDDSGSGHRFKRGHDLNPCFRDAPASHPLLLFYDLRVNLNLHRVANRRFAAL
jgi:hypothetical protein